jgi:hypothetical protein
MDRLDGPDAAVLEAGWHFSFLGGPARVVRKLQATSHTECGDPAWANVENVARLILGGLDPHPTRGWVLREGPLDGPDWLISTGVTKWPWLRTAGVR